MKNLHQQVLELLPQCIEDRRWLHRHAELSFREYKTADYLEQALCELEGLELSRPTPTSVMAVLRTGRPGRCLAIRADSDALPIREENELDYRSCNEGVMHACGHDMHTAILLGTAMLLKELEPELVQGQLPEPDRLHRLQGRKSSSGHCPSSDRCPSSCR